MINIFVSNFAEHLKNMRTLKHNAGFSLKYMDKHLNEFDCYCQKYFPDKKILNRNLVDSWVYYTTSKSLQEIEKRFRTMAHLANYMLSIGLESYVAQSFGRRVKHAEPHIFTDVQLKEFFTNSDSFEQRKYPPYRHLVAAIIFRMIYCCGLRNSEACNLKCNDINLESGTMKIYNSKGHKSRIVYMSDDLTMLCKKYNSVIERIHTRSEQKYFFPSSQVDHYKNSTLCALFNRILKTTSFYGQTSKKPTCHGLRHTFAVNSMRKCIKEGENFDVMIHYLSRYMGHSSPQNTMYYLHMTVNLVHEIREKIKKYEDIINGVAYVEE